MDTKPEKRLTFGEVSAELQRMHKELQKAFNEFDKVKVWGVPSHGRLIAYMLKTRYPRKYDVMETAELADAAVDSMYCQGHAAGMIKAAFKMDVYALLDARQNKAVTQFTWSFPWEQREDDYEYLIAALKDLPIRGYIAEILQDNKEISDGLTGFMK